MPTYYTTVTWELDMQSPHQDLEFDVGLSMFELITCQFWPQPCTALTGKKNMHGDSFLLSSHQNWTLLKENWGRKCLWHLERFLAHSCGITTASCRLSFYLIVRHKKTGPHSRCSQCFLTTRPKTPHIKYSMKCLNGGGGGDNFIIRCHLYERGDLIESLKIQSGATVQNRPIIINILHIILNCTKWELLFC